MYIASPSEAKLLAASVIASMQRHRIPPTPDNYTLWYEYHAGLNPSLVRTMDVIISNHAGFDETALHDLYVTFVSSAREAEVVRETSVNVQAALRNLIGVALRTGTEADEFGNVLTILAAKDYGKNADGLRELVGHLVRESQKMAEKSMHAGAQMRESSERIETLERRLDDALLEAQTDGLTGAANRRSFDAALRKLAGEAMNTGDSLALLMIDVDQFKRVNDIWGHTVGDEVLRHLATTLKQAVRGQDLVARYGGEEFAVILPHTNAAAAISVAENIRHALAREPVRLNVSPPVHPVTVSIGVSCYEPGDPLAEWIGRADVALYRAKQEGRNCVQYA